MSGFDLVAPCGNCPFRSDGKGIKLRAEAVTDLQQSFFCHKFTIHDDDDSDADAAANYQPHKGDQHCAGALYTIYTTNAFAADWVKYHAHGDAATSGV